MKVNDRMRKSDLKLNRRYQWTTTQGDNPILTGNPDRALFNRYEGYEVLRLINQVALETGFNPIVCGYMLETVISEFLPSNIRKRSKVKTWLKANWENIALKVLHSKLG